MSVLTANSRRDLEIHRYPAPLYLIAPVIALVLQALLPRVVGRFTYFDLPLVVTVYFALGRRSPIQGMFIGGLVGIFDALKQTGKNVPVQVQVTLEATGSGTALTIDMDDPATAPRLYNQALPYNHTVNVALKSGDLLQIVVEPKGNEHPGCRILVNGKVVVEQPHGGMAQCVYNVP